MTEILIGLFIGKGDSGNPAIRKKYGFLSGIVGIVLNILLFSGKLLAGIFSGAISVIADSINNLSDAGSSIVNMVGFKIALAPPDREHPFGHGRAEYVSGLVISFIIMLMGAELARNSFEKIVYPEMPKVSVFTFTVLVVSVAVKLWMFVFNRSLGNRINSVSLKAAAMDSISDVAATLAVIIGMAVAYAFKVNIDGFIGLLVSFFIFYSGIKTAKDSLSPLLGQMPEKELVGDIKNTVCGYEGIIGIHDLIVHNYGVGVSYVSFHAEVASSMELTVAHQLIDIIEKDLKKKFNCTVTIHIDPVDLEDTETALLCRKVTDIIKAIDRALSIHDFRVLRDKGEKSVVFDLVLPYKFKYSDIDIRNMVSDAVKEIDSEADIIINVERQLSELD
ncbi:MAG: cation diffusion facilitator family transporter [Firmicutes bacterium]|nr:cation diffusion facilitator family transporter [Bacillota bacterium]